MTMKVISLDGLSSQQKLVTVCALVAQERSRRGLVEEPSALRRLWARITGR